MEKMMRIDFAWLKNAIEIVSSNRAGKLTKGNITVYRVNNIIRIDIKED